MNEVWKKPPISLDAYQEMVGDEFKVQQGFGAPNPQAGTIKPAPIPTLPTPPPRVRPIIPRNPASPAATPEGTPAEL